MSRDLPFAVFRYDPSCDSEREWEIRRQTQLAMENGARRALIPIENRRQFLDVSGDVAERLDPIFYGEPPVAANKALGIT
jgi:predicted ATP-dependent Lon-type protease